MNANLVILSGGRIVDNIGGGNGYVAAFIPLQMYMTETIFSSKDTQRKIQNFRGTFCYPTTIDDFTM